MTRARGDRPVSRADPIGAWRLWAFELRWADGATLRPWGPEVDGLLSYAADGRMAVQLMRVDRPRFGSEDASGGTAEQIGAAFAGYVAYWGTYALDEGSAAVVHRVEGSLFPDRVGGEQPRRVALADDRLTLSTPSIEASSPFLRRSRPARSLSVDSSQPTTRTVPRVGARKDAGAEGAEAGAGPLRRQPSGRPGRRLRASVGR